MMNKNNLWMVSLAAALLLLSSCGDSGINPPGGGGGVQAVPSTSLQAMLERHNDERNSEGEPDLAVDQRLNEIAREQARFMAEQDDLTHVDASGDRVNDRADEIGYDWNFIGENIAFSQSGQAAFNLWLGSNDHYANIINDDYTEIGIGAYVNDFGQYWCVVFGDE
jgi:uncharacterized protein YkwD